MHPFQRIEVIRQATRNECILACVAMLSRYYGATNTLADLRAAYPALSRGGTLRDLRDIAHSSGLGARALKVPLEDLSELQMPCIIHWNFDHFVVVERATKSHLYIVDPAIGRRKLSVRIAANHYTGVAVEITPRGPSSITTVPQGQKSTLGALLRPFVPDLTKLVMLSLMLVGLALATPMAVQIIVDQVIVAGDVDMLAVLAIVFLLIHAQAALVGYAQSMHIARFSSRVRLMLIYEYATRVLQLPWAYFADRSLGHMVAQYGSLNFIVNAVVKSVAFLVTDALAVGAMSIALLVLDFQLAALVLAVNVGLVLLRLVLAQRMKALQTESVSTVAQEEAYFVETMRGILSVKSNDLAGVRRDEGMARAIDSVNAAFQEGAFSERYRLTMGLLKAGEVILILYFLAHAVMAGQMTIGVMYVFYSYRLFIDDRMSRLVGSAGELLNVRVHLDRLDDAFRQQVHQPPPRALSGSLRLSGAVQLIDIDYSIDNQRTKLFSRLSFELKKGQFAAITGPTGVGKSTLLRIILGLLAPDAGEVELDGVRASDEFRAMFEGSIGTVMQEDVLFSGTILENVSLFDEAPNLAMVEHCCRVAQVHAEIMKMPMGYITEVGDMGTAMSTGQRQRVLIARALYRNPAILVFDEATANLDEDTEARVLDALKALDKTVIFAAHSRLVKERADLVVELGAP